MGLRLGLQNWTRCSTHLTKQGLRGIEWAILEVENARKLGIAGRFCILAEPRIRVAACCRGAAGGKPADRALRDWRPFPSSRPALGHTAATAARVGLSGRTEH